MCRRCRRVDACLAAPRFPGRPPPMVCCHPCIHRSTTAQPSAAHSPPKIYRSARLSPTSRTRRDASLLSTPCTRCTTRRAMRRWRWARCAQGAALRHAGRSGAKWRSATSARPRRATGTLSHSSMRRFGRRRSRRWCASIMWRTGRACGPNATSSERCANKQRAASTHPPHSTAPVRVLKPTVLCAPVCPGCAIVRRCDWYAVAALWRCACLQLELLKLSRDRPAAGSSGSCAPGSACRGRASTTGSVDVASRASTPFSEV